jgi:ligand-binding sensor domain-containing protein/signal transduction histidine kinase
MRLRRWLAAFLALFWALDTFAAEPAAVAVQTPDVPGLVTIRFQPLGIEQGLSQATARVLAQDREGLIWIGTQDGLNRYDGEDFLVFRRDQQALGSLPDNHVSALLVDRGGVLWVGTQSGGLGRYDADDESFANFAIGPSALASAQVHALAEDTQGALWVASGRGHLQRLDATRTRFEHLEVPLDTQILALLPLPDGDVIAGGSGGLWRYRARDGRMQRWAPSLARGSGGVQALARDARGRIWVGTAARGVLLFDDAGNELAQVQDSDGLAGNDVRALLVDRAGRVWIGTYTSLSRIDADGAAPRSWGRDDARRDGLGSERVHALLEDRDGLVWVGTWLGGAYFYTPASDAFREFRSRAGEPRALPGNAVRCLIADADDRLWLGVQEGGGLVQFDPQRGVLQQFLPRAGDEGSLASDRVQALARDLDGNLWIGFVDAGLDRLRPGATKFEHRPAAIDDPREPQHDNVLTMHVDRAGTLWIGYQDAGMDSLCRGCSEFRRFVHAPGQSDGLPANSIGAIYETGNGDLWVGARPGGLSRFDRTSGKFTAIETLLAGPDDAAPRAITAIVESRAGDLWIGTQGSGVVRLVPTPGGRYRGVAYTYKQGMAAEAIGSLIEDESGAMWVSTTLGITRIDPANGRIENFSARSGAQADGYFVGAGARLGDGSIAYGGLRGVTMFDPSRVSVRNELRAPVVTEVRVLQSRSSAAGPAWRFRRGELQGTADDLWLRAGGGGFSLAFSALAFADPELVQYAYRLDPLDRGWIDVAARQRNAAYPHLAPGDYTLRVRARYPGEAYSAERRIDVRLDPLWWQTLWARGALALVVLTLLALWGGNRRQQTRERARAQAVLADSEERLKLALWGTGDEFWDADLRSGRLVRMNPLAHLRVTHEATDHSLSGYTPFVHADDLTAFREALSAHVQGHTDDFDITFRTQDVTHEWRWLRTRGRSVERDDNNRAVRMAGISQDITELKEFEHTLRRINQQLEERVEARTAELTRLNTDLVHTIEQLQLTQHQLVESEKLAALGGLVAGIAHEINTPLGVGVTAASHLEQQARHFEQRLAQGTLSAAEIENFRAVVSDCAAMVLRNLQRADKMIRSFKQVAVDQASEQARSFDLRAYLDEILTSLKPALKRGRHTLDVDIAPHIVVHTYPGALYQIVANLVMNSLTHAFEGRDQGAMRFTARLEGEVLRLEFSDDGIGMGEEVRRRIFEPFFTTRRGRGGSGLGMHIAYNLVTQRLGGSIECHSTPGVGTRFVLRIPSSQG